MTSAHGLDKVPMRRRLGFLALLFVAVGLAYQTVWHVLDGSWPGTLWLLAAVAAVVGAFVAVVELRSPGPRWGLRCLLVLLVLVLGAEWARSLLAFLDSAVTDAVMGQDSVQARWWEVLPVLVPAVVALLGSWPARAATDVE